MSKSDAVCGISLLIICENHEPPWIAWNISAPIFFGVSDVDLLTNSLVVTLCTPALSALCPSSVCNSPAPICRCFWQLTGRGVILCLVESPPPPMMG